MKKVEDKIKKARRIARQIEQALSDGNWEQVAPDSPRLREEVGIPARLHEKAVSKTSRNSSEFSG